MYGQPKVLTPEKLEKIKQDIAEVLDKDPEYDGIGHYGPVLVRLAWHSSGSYDKNTNTGGSYGATMRFASEAKIAANRGLEVARNLLEPIKKKYGSAISYGDLWTLAGVVAVQEMGGPEVEWRAGRVDAKDDSSCPPDGRLPDASKGSSHIRDIFYRMGFNDQEIVALCGAHAVGKCHTDRSGFKGPWTFSPVSFTNSYYTMLLDNEWVEKSTDTDNLGRKVQWKGPKQYVDKATGEIMMLPTDMELIRDPKFRKWVEIYAKDQDKFFKDFADVFSRLLELGCKNLRKIE